MCRKNYSRHEIHFIDVFRMLKIRLRKFAASIILRRFPRERDGLAGDFLVLQRTFRRSGFIQDGHLEAAFVYAAAVLQQQMVQSRIGSLSVDDVHDRVIADRCDRRPVVGSQFVASYAPRRLWRWFADEVDIRVENKSGLDANVLQGRLDFRGH